MTNASQPYDSREALSLFTPIIDDENKANLQALLYKMGQDVDHIPGLPFLEMPEMHFARFFILDGDVERSVPARLVYAASVDGPWESHLRSLIIRSPRLLDLYRHCSGFAEDREGVNSLLFFQYLSRHRVEPLVFFQGTVGRSIAQLKEEAVLYEALNNFFDEGHRSGRWTGTTALRILTDARTFIQSQPNRFPQDQEPARSWLNCFAQYGGLARKLLVLFTPLVLLSLAAEFYIVHHADISFSIVHVFLLFALVVLFSVASLSVAIRVHEKSHARPEDVFPRSYRMDFSNARTVADQEDYQVQNQLTLSIPIKSSRFRHGLLQLVLWVGHALVRYVFTAGSLFGIQSIHFARFHIDRQLDTMLFFSNYDGNWEEYLEDFLTTGKAAVVPAWANLQWCPRTRWLVSPVQGFGSIFKPYIRYHQIRTNVWYSAYRDLTTTNINNNTAIRKGLWKARTESDALAWLQLFSK